MGFLDDYEPVENRLRDFWGDHPEGRIVTKLLSFEAGVYVVQASVWRDSDNDTITPSATGLARDSEAQLPANMKASALEVCETSAIGRALANLGYAPKGKRPSREEMSKSSGAGAGGSTPAPGPKSSPAPVSKRDERGNQDGPMTVADEVGPQREGVGKPLPAAAPSHVHEWIPAPNERMARLGWESCSVPKCQETRNQRKGK